MENQEITQEQSAASIPAQPIAPTPVAIPEVLTQQQALQVLVDAARAAQAKGIFTLEDAELVSKAIKAFMPKGGPVSSI